MDLFFRFLSGTLDRFLFVLGHGLSGFGFPGFEFLGPACDVHQLFFAGEERMALAADFDLDIGSGRARLEKSAASTMDFGVRMVLGMKLFFHNLYKGILAPVVGVDKPVNKNIIENTVFRLARQPGLEESHLINK